MLLKKNIPNSRLDCTNHILFQTKMVEIDTLFQTKTAEKNIPFSAAHTSLYKGLPSGRKKLVADDVLIFYKNKGKVDPHIAKLTVDLSQISYINLNELGGPYLNRAPAFKGHEKRKESLFSLLLSPDLRRNCTTRQTSKHLIPAMLTVPDRIKISL